MRAVVTRVREASVTIDGECVGRIGQGFLVLLGVGPEDTEREAERLADKICGLRIFEDEKGKMNINPKDAGAKLLISGKRGDSFHLTVHAVRRFEEPASRIF